MDLEQNPFKLCAGGGRTGQGKCIQLNGARTPPQTWLLFLMADALLGGVQCCGLLQA